MGINVFIFAISFIQGLIFSLIILFSKFYKSNANKYLAFTILIISFIGLINGFEELLGDTNLFIYDFVAIIPWEVLFPATFITYILLKLKVELFKGKHFFLYLPFCLFSIINILIIVLDVFGMLPDYNLIYLLFDIQYYSIILFSFLSGAFCFVLVKRAKKIEVASKKWLTYLISMYFVLISLWIFFELYSTFFGEAIYMEYILWLGITTFFYWISYKGLIRFKLLEDRFEITQIIKSKLSKEKKDTPRDVSNVHFLKLEKLMQNDHLYLDSSLSREYVAEKIGISPGYLSKIINTITKSNFSEYINSYRVEAVKKMINNPEFNNYSLLAIGYESGFSSKTGYYNAFKKHIGMTPKSYKAENK